jgi:hypothetical protein
MGETVKAIPDEVTSIDAEDHNADAEVTPLFSDESVSDADLRGEPTEEEPADSGPTGETEDKESSEPEGGDKETQSVSEAKPEGEVENKEKPDESSTEDKQVEEKPADSKPPKGFLPVAAVQKERRKAQSLAVELEAAKAEIEAMKEQTAEPDELEDFKVLSIKEFQDLLSEDPDEANLYQYKHQQYLERKREAKQAEQAKERARATEMSIISEGLDECEKVLPGFKDQSNPDIQKIADYAVDEIGIEPDILYDMTNPGTKIVNAKGEQYILGVGAAQLIKMIKTAHAVPSAESIRKEVEAELRPQLTAEIQKDLIKKLKSGEGFRSLDSASASSRKEAAPVTGGSMSEKEFASKSPEEQRELLGG